MRSMKNMIYFGLLTIVILAQFYYLFTDYKEDKALIDSNKQEIASVEQRINQLEERLVKHEESKQELARLEIQKTALLDTIPNQLAYSKYLSNFNNYLSLMKCMKLTIIDNGTEIIQNEIGTINKRSYSVTFTSTYTTSKKFIERIASMYQASNISEYSFNTSPQETEGEDRIGYLTFFGDDFNEVGETNFTFTTFYRMDNTVPDEVYQEGISGRVSSEPFKTSKVEIAETSVSNVVELPDFEPVVEPIPELPASDSQFKLNIGDILSSGDTYKISGPGEGEAGYIGIISDTNATIKMTVYDDHYELSVEDEKGQVKETKVNIPINMPTLRIISTMREVYTVMPNVHVNIYNYSSQKMQISIEGSLLDNIHIYNEKGQEVTKGQAKGNISLT